MTDLPVEAQVVETEVAAEAPVVEAQVKQDATALEQAKSVLVELGHDASEAVALIEDLWDKGFALVHKERPPS